MRQSVVRTALLAWALVVGRGAAADEEYLPGHSHLGREFNRGPRQDAYLMGGTGNVHFPVTTKNPLVQKYIDQGIGQLHGFWFVEAERSFRKAQSLDPDCGIAYWGISLANHFTPDRAREFAKLAKKHKAGLSEREQMFIDGLADGSGYKAVIKKYPNDLEAKAFEVWRIWHKCEHSGLSSHELQHDAWELAHEILAVDPMHPISHFVIHKASATGTENTALDAAAHCGIAAPSIGHMWHMPTHIYFALKRYPEAAWQLEASIRTEHARMMHDRVLPDQVHFYAHNNEWLVRTLLYMGRPNDARRTAMCMIDLPRHPLLNVIEPPERASDEIENDDDPRAKEKLVEVHGTSAYHGRDRLLQTLRQYEYWDDLIKFCKSGYIEPTALPAEQGKVHLNLGVAAYTLGDVPAGNKELAEMLKLLDAEAAARQAAIAEAQKRPRNELARAVAFAKAKHSRPTAELKSYVKQLESYRTIATGYFVGRTMLYVYLGGIFVLEALVFWFLRRRMLTAILTSVLAVAAGVWVFHCHLNLIYLPYNSTNVDFAFMSRMQLEAGDPDVAEWCAREFASNRQYQVRPQANLVEILYRVGKKDEARAEFEILRDLAGTADLDCPALARLAPIAREFDFPTDWRRPEKINKALAGRRDLASLGPLVWRPWEAPQWKLKDAQGKEHTLADFRGKPVLMVFFLGRGCLHCKQQIETFVKKSKQCFEQGLHVVAVSVDDQAGIKKSLDDFQSKSMDGSKPAPFPFLMLSDPDKTVFKAFRAYDDFEGGPLHGTYLIDGGGFVRWHDVSFEPFTDVNFVLGESKRLLGQPVPPVEPGARVIADAPDRTSIPVQAAARR